jgi:hypothetical protein
VLKDEELDDLEDAALELVLAFVEAKLSAGLVNVAEDIEVEVELFEVLLELAEDCNVDRIRNEEIIDIEIVSVVGGPVWPCVEITYTVPTVVKTLAV